jgi:transcriptional regulator with XRE-family HTH domain
MSGKLNKIIGSRIKYLRTLQNLTQAELAERADCDLSTISHIEIGSNSPSTALLDKIAKALNVEIWKLFIKRDVKTDEDVIQSINDLLKMADKAQLLIVHEIIGNILSLKKNR